MRRSAELARLVVLAAGAACAAPATPVFDAEPWPAADALFERDARWLGGDAVYSVDLGHDRILWLFGDSFVATDASRDRRTAAMVRNSLAVQKGRDPARATLAFHWRQGADGRPAAFFADDGAHGFWPLHGIRLADGPLYLFQTRVRNTPGQGLGFAIDGWRLLCVEDPDGDPQQWLWREVQVGATPTGASVGTAVWRDGDCVVALGTQGNGPHRGSLWRFPIADLARGRVQPEWWDGGRWCAATDPAARAGAPAVVLADAGPECSLHHAADHWLHVQSRGFGATTVAVHTAAAATGPWSAPLDVFTPPESQRQHPFVYAAKAHPEVDAGQGWLAVSYASNAFDFAELFTEVGRRQLYWPRFWRIRAR